MAKSTALRQEKDVFYTCEGGACGYNVFIVGRMEQYTRMECENFTNAYGEAKTS